MTVRAAVNRGHALVTAPVFTIMALVAGIGVLIVRQPVLQAATIFSAPFVAWMWWSYTVPHWRRWALRQGVDPDELQALAERENLVWPRGHFFEKTEFRIKQ